MSRIHNLSAIASLPIKTVMNPASLDPIDFVSTRVTHDRAKQSILSSMAWSIDMLLLGTLRSLFFSVFRDMQANGDIDSYNEFLATMSEKEGAEANLVEQGFTNRAGDIDTARKLMLLRQEWHDAALRGASADRRMLTVEELLRSERPQQVTALTRAKLEALAEDDAGGDKELAAEVLKELLLREEMQALDRHESNKQRVPAMCHMAHFIEATGTANSAEFSELPLDVRKRLILSIQRSISQATQRLTSDRSVSVIEFLAVRKELKAVATEVEQMLEHPSLNSEDGVIGQEHIDDARVTRDLATADGDQALVKQAAAAQRKRKAAGVAAS